ncbi:MAG: metallophosphoesterase family protein, partial [Thermoplasmata archaeon]
IAGNHDRAAVTRDISNFNDYAAEAVLWTADNLTMENIGYLNKLPRRKRFEFEGVNLLMVHGSPNDDDEYLSAEDVTEEYIKKADCEVLIVGHSHVQWTVKVADKLAFNPGSVGQPRDRNPDASYALLTLPQKRVEQKRIKYDIDLTARMIQKAGLPRILANRLYIGY